ncbi:hypothetical protein DFP91_5030 [Pseudorhodoplanes sinuspersici]|nr:hypothetical protein DFP91_5030 [Pseudorhodoplanes sinuspersici]
MQAERSQSPASDYDTFTCLRCELVLSYKRDKAPVLDTAERDKLTPSDHD